jgi:hypothetical protein
MELELVKADITFTFSKILSIIIFAVCSVYSFVFKESNVLVAGATIAGSLVGAKTIFPVGIKKLDK